MQLLLLQEALADEGFDVMNRFRQIINNNSEVFKYPFTTSESETPGGHQPRDSAAIRPPAAQSSEIVRALTPSSMSGAFLLRFGLTSRRIR